MGVPYKVHVDLLSLNTTKFELIDTGGPDTEASTEVLPNGSGNFLQEDARQQKNQYRHEFAVKVAGADDEDTDTDCPRSGKHTGLSSRIYWIDTVQRGKNGSHRTIVVNFHRFSDIDATRGQMTRSDLGLS